MTPLMFVGVIVLAVILLSVLTLRYKVHPVITLFLVALLIGILTGHDVVESITLIKKYFGSTLSGIGVLIIFGATIASGINDTGAATSIANFFIRLFKGKRLELAPALTGFIMSIPVFGDIAIVLNAPIAAVLAKRKKISMAVMAPMVNLGLTLTHGLVPPTPGILAVALLLGADIGTVIFWGLICSVISFVLSYLIARPFLARAEFIEPLDSFAEGVQPVQAGAGVGKLLIEGKNTPGALAAFAPVLIPAVMIAIGSFAKMVCEKGTTMYKVFETVGDSTIALFCGILAVAFLVFSRKDTVVEKANEQGYQLTRQSGFCEIVFDNWVVRALLIAIGPLLITAMGGAMGGILRENSAITEIGNLVAASQFPKLLVPFVVSAVLMAVCGSMTTASMAAAGLLAPMAPMLGLSPVTISLAIGSGVMCFWHVNNSGFWVFSSLYNMNARQGLKYLTTVNALGGVVAFAALCVFNLAGLV
ncbi:MAG: SLC13 family permease [Rhodocyclaceae bacterium]